MRMQIIKKHKYFFVALGLVLLSVFALFKMEYATDTYCAYSIKLSGIRDAMYTNGRYITGLFAELFSKNNWSITSFYYTSYILSLIFMTFAVYNVYTILKQHTSNIKSILISFISVFNLASIEYFLFMEKGAFAFSIFSATLAFKFFVSFMQGKKWYLPFAYVCLILSALTYQIIPGIFIALSLPFIVLYSKSAKSFIINNLIAISIYGSGTILDYTIVRLTQQNERLGSGFHLSNIIKFYSFGFGETFAVLLFIGAIVLVSACVLIARFLLFKERPCKKSILFCAKYIYITLGVMAVTVLPFVFTNPSEVWFMFRVAYPLFSMPGVLLMGIFIQPNAESIIQSNKLCKILSKCCVLASFAMVVVSLCFFNAMTFSRLKTNEEDKKLYNLIYAEIEKYEQETNIQVTKVIVYEDSNLTIVYPGVLSFGDCNVRAYSKPWSDVAVLMTFSGRTFIRNWDENKLNEEYKQYFSSQNWDYFSPEQLIFDKDTLHICSY